MKEKFKCFFAALGYLLLGFAIQLIISIFASIILSIIYISKNGTEFISNPDLIANAILQSTTNILLVSSIVTVIVLIVMYKIKKLNIKTELLLYKTKGINLIIGFLLGLSLWSINTGALSLIESTGLFKSAFNSFSELSSVLTNSSLFSMILVAGFIAPIAEEFLFRGVIYRTLNRKLSIVASIIIQGVLFGVYHGNIIQGVYASFIGIVLGYITYKSNSLYPAIIAHISNNLTATLIAKILPESFDTPLVYSLLLIIGIIATILIVILINKNNNISTDEKILYS